MAGRPELTLPLSLDSMRRAIDRLANEVFDLLVIGGGVTGACVARDARRCSAPMISAISPSTAVPPSATSRSVTRPSVGFDASPDV